MHWHHRPAQLRAALERFAGMADWKPAFHLLAVPTESVIGSANTVFNLARLDQRRDCRLRIEAPPPRRGTTAHDSYIQKALDEQEARNAELREADYGHIPPLGLADRYANGKRTNHRAAQKRRQ